MKSQCVKCGKKYPADFVEKWGTTPESSGHGAAAKCVELRPVTVQGKQSNELCSGQLVYLPEK